MNDTKEKIIKKIDSLINKLNQWEYEYYALENPSVSDYEYDITLKELKEIEELNPDLKRIDSPTNRVGGHVSEKFNKFKHEIPMLSLGNAFDENDLIKFDSDIKKELNIQKVEYVVEPKIDGLSISLHYDDGYLVKAITRGDGTIGEDVTENIKTIKSIPLKILFKNKIEVRGEIFLTKDNFKKINNDPNLVKKFANARNAASGSLRNLDTKVTANRNLSGYFYYVPENKKIDKHTQYDVLTWLNENKIMTSKETVKCDDIEQVIKRIKYLTENRENFKYDIDGIVIKVNNISYYDELGYTSKFPKWAIAYKFPANIKISLLKSIDVTVGRTGRLNFIANLEPIEIDGSIVSKATLHNAEYIYDKDIRINDLVEVYKAGDIIPKIISPILEKRTNDTIKWEKPLYCPSCNSKLVKFKNEVDQYCINKNCKDKIIQQITHFCSRDAMNIEGVSEAMIQKFYENNLINDVSDLYILKNKKDIIIKLDLLIKEKSFNNIVEAIEKTKSNSLEKLIFGLGIRHVGFNAAKLLCKRFKTLQNIANASFEEIQDIGEIGEKMAKSIVMWFKDEENITLISKLVSYSINTSFIDEYASFVVPDKNLKYMNKNFVITGSFEQNRNIIKNILESVYHSKVSSSVTKNTNYVIVGSGATKSKIDKAIQLNKELIKEEFWK